MKTNRLTNVLFAAQLRRLREQAGMTQFSLGSAVGIQSTSIARLESGAIDPKFSTIVKLAEALKCTPAELVT